MLIPGLPCSGAAHIPGRGCLEERSSCRLCRHLPGLLVGSGTPLGKGLRNACGEPAQASCSRAQARPTLHRSLAAPVQLLPDATLQCCGDRAITPSPIRQVLLECQKHPAGEVTLGRKVCRGNPDKCDISPGRGSSTPPTRPASTLLRCWRRETRRQVGQMGRSHPLLLLPMDPAMAKASPCISLGAVLGASLGSKARHTPAQQTLNLWVLHPGSDTTVPRDLS